MAAPSSWFGWTSPRYTRPRTVSKRGPLLPAPTAAATMTRRDGAGAAHVRRHLGRPGRVPDGDGHDALRAARLGVRANRPRHRRGAPRVLLVRPDARGEPARRRLGGPPGPPTGHAHRRRPRRPDDG